MSERCRLVLAVGLLEHFCGYFGLWLAATGRLALPYFGTVCLTVMAFNGSNWVDTACIATNLHNFPHHRGNVVGGPPSFLLGSKETSAVCSVESHRVPSLPEVALSAETRVQSFDAHTWGDIPLLPSDNT